MASELEVWWIMIISAGGFLVPGSIAGTRWRHWKNGVKHGVKSHVTFGNVVKWWIITLLIGGIVTGSTIYVFVMLGGGAD